jgi:truncated hemoglobin YjbI
MTHVDENPTNDAKAGEAEAASEAGAPVRSVATKQWLDAMLEAINCVDVDEALRRRIAQRIF